MLTKGKSMKRSWFIILSFFCVVEASHGFEATTLWGTVDGVEYRLEVDWVPKAPLA